MNSILRMNTANKCHRFPLKNQTIVMPLGGML